MSRRKKNRSIADDTFEPTSILNITWELKDFFQRRAQKFQLLKLAMGLLNGQECIYLMLKDGRRVRVRIEEIKLGEAKS